MRPRSQRPWLLIPAGLFLLAGCEEPRHVGNPQTAATPAPQEGAGHMGNVVGVDVGNPPPAAAPAPVTGQATAPAPQPKKDTFIVGQKTTDIRPAQAEVAKGAQVATQKITAKDPITLQGNAYVTIIGQTSILNIQHAMDLYNAEHGHFPKNYDEFMTEIIKANGIALPQLPFYQKYGYDENQHKLIVLEYPDLKAGPNPAQ